MTVAVCWQSDVCSNDSYYVLTVRCMQWWQLLCADGEMYAMMIAVCWWSDICSDDNEICCVLLVRCVQWWQLLMVRWWRVQEDGDVHKRPLCQPRWQLQVHLWCWLHPIWQWRGLHWWVVIMSFVTIAFAEIRPPIIWTGKSWFRWVEVSRNGWWTGKNQERIFQNHSNCHLCLDYVTSMFVCYFRL